MAFFKKLMFVLLDPRGRIKRGQFWLAWILILLLGFGLRDARQDTGTVILSLTYLYLAITIYGKRLHDVGRSTWGIVLPGVLHIGVLIVSSYLIQNAFDGSMRGGNLNMDDVTFIGNISSILPLVIWTIYAFFVGLPQGHAGDNRFGFDPRQDKAVASAPGAART